MKLFHISDLHIGKRVNGFSMLEDQNYILNQIVELAEEHRPEGILIAGDLYDRSMPSAEAVELADDFLYQFAKLQIPVFLISGNHDCAERIAYGGRMMEQAGIYVSRVFGGEMQKYTMQLTAESAEICAQCDRRQAYVDIWLLPYIKPAQVRRFYPEDEIETTQQAIEVILKHTELDTDRINILVMHQFIAGSSVCESEEMSVGGSDQVDVSVVEAFDYVALGHLHRPQKVGRDTVRYCGSPLKYSFSEAGHRKSITVIEISENSRFQDLSGNPGAGFASAHTSSKILDEKETERNIRISQLPLIPRLDLREIRGPIDELLRPEVYESANALDYLHITLTDKDEVLDAIGRLRDVYPNIMRLDFASAGEGAAAEHQEIQLEEKTPLELFAEFFALQNGYEMSEEQNRVIREIWEIEEDVKQTESGEMAAKGGDGV